MSEIQAYLVDTEPLRWTIKNGGDKEYRVQKFDNGKWECTCNDCWYRKRECKHIKAVKEQFDTTIESHRASQSDAVNHPSHYNQGSIECIDYIEDQKLPFHLANAVKYIVRCRFKGSEEQDIDKAIFYLNRYKNLVALEQPQSQSD